MLKPMTKKGKLLALAGIFFLGLFFLLYPLVSVLTVIDVKKNVPVLYVKAWDGQEFSLSFTHSVNKRPVRDFIRIAGDQLVVVRSEYDAFGAGMPETSQGEMTVRLTPEGKLVLDNINRTLPEITVFVGTVANHVLHVSGREIPLAELVPPGNPAKFKITKASYITLLRGRCIQ
jgi:hypothetical protein